MSVMTRGVKVCQRVSRVVERSQGVSDVSRGFRFKR